MKIYCYSKLFCCISLPDQPPRSILLLQRRIFYKTFLIVINGSVLSKFAVVSLNLPSLYTIFIAWCTAKGHEGQPQCGE